jgi:dienelactone hydrolase
MKRSRRRRTVIVLAALTVLLVTLAIVGLSGVTQSKQARSAGEQTTVPNIRGQSSQSSTSVLPTRSTAPPSAPPALSLPVRGLAVTMSQVPIVDVSRQVVSNGIVVAPERTLPTYVWTPSGSGPFPLVVFIHGYDVGPLTYERFCSTLAAAGYVVAAPSFPLEDPASGLGLNEADLPNEAADVSFVITTLGGGPLASKIDLKEVAVVGHSDGADVALMMSYEQGTSDGRVRAVVSDAPDPISRSAVSSSVPLLLIQGTADSVVPYSASETVFSQVQAPIYYLSLIGADHLAPIAGGTPWTPVLDNAVADFLDATLAGRGPGPSALAGQLAASPLAKLQTTP